MEATRKTKIPHGENCCGCLTAVKRGTRAEIICNECGDVICAVAPEEVDQVLLELVRTQQACSAMCPHCGSVNIFPGMSEIRAYVCSQCGEGVSVETTVQ
jgi:predicted RNA-binding Zn-ribbon protein involved in translation (DUF1610 family)